MATAGGQQGYMRLKQINSKEIKTETKIKTKPTKSSHHIPSPCTLSPSSPLLCSVPSRYVCGLSTPLPPSRLPSSSVTLPWGKKFPTLSAVSLELLRTSTRLRSSVRGRGYQKEDEKDRRHQPSVKSLMLLLLGQR